jgi:hypothetical protein
MQVVGRTCGGVGSSQTSSSLLPSVVGTDTIVAALSHATSSHGTSTATSTSARSTTQRIESPQITCSKYGTDTNSRTVRLLQSRRRMATMDHYQKAPPADLTIEQLQRWLRIKITADVMLSEHETFLGEVTDAVRNELWTVATALYDKGEDAALAVIHDREEGSTEQAIDTSQWTGIINTVEVTHVGQVPPVHS